MCDLFYRLAHSVVDGRDYRGDDAAFDLGRLDLIDLQNGFDGNGKLQGCGVLVRGDTFHKQDLIFLESADDNIGVADINGKYHKRTSCFIARKRETKNRTLVKSSVFEVPVYTVKIELEIHKKKLPTPV